MRTPKNLILKGIAIIASTLLLSSCKDDDNKVVPVPNKTTYVLSSKDVTGVIGTVTFTESSNSTTTIDIALLGADPGVDHPAHILINAAIETGNISINLNPVDANGKSSTIISKLNDGTLITYNQLINYDGYINIHKSASESSVIIAQGDIGGNTITTTSKTFPIANVNNSSIAGNAKFEKRKNGTTLVTISLNGTQSSIIYSAGIRAGSTTALGDQVKSLSDIDGATGKSITNLRNLGNGNTMTYDNWMAYVGYIEIKEPTLLSSVAVARGDIGTH